MRLLFVTGEPSGDRLAAAAVRALRRLRPDVDVSAMGGAALREAGARILVDSSHLGVVGVTEVVAHLPELLRARATLRKEIATRPPDVLVPVDYPDFNLGIARFARARGVPVAWLVGPQVWAWRAGRVPTFASAVSRMLVLFPFEVATWRDAGVPALHVGHPMAELKEIPREEARAQLGLADASGPILALLPGSRRKELQRVWPTLVEATSILASGRPGLRVVVPLAPGLSQRDAPGPAPRACMFLTGGAREAVAACDVAAVASGTATLETALALRPLVACYRVGRLTMALSRRAAAPGFVERGIFALPNLVLGRKVVPELYQERFTPGAVAEELARLLDDASARETMLTALAELRGALLGDESSERIARGILDTAR